MFEKEFVDRLKELYAGGRTYEEIADLTGISRSALGRVISGSRPPKNLTVDALLKAFPQATISLHGEVVAPVINNGNNSGVMQTNVATLDCVVNKILESEELSDSEKIKVLKVLKK